jgi:hypothetical protein
MTCGWLGCLIWPGEADRRERLLLAVETARRDPPPVYQGDLLTDVPALAREAPRGATLVIYHSAVLAYVDRARRAEFARTVRGLSLDAGAGRGAAWISNEAPGVIADAPIALADGHGTWLHWLPAES